MGSTFRLESPPGLILQHEVNFHPRGIWRHSALCKFLAEQFPNLALASHLLRDLYVLVLGELKLCESRVLAAALGISERTAKRF
jgi:hypothetical protein